jgi:hypothetical protein
MAHTFEFRNTFGSNDTVPKETAAYDFITVLAVAQKLQVEILPITWQSTRELAGRGKTSEISQSSINLQTSLAFKRVAKKDKRYEPEGQIFQSVINEITALCHPSIRNHPNIVELQGICWDIPVKEDIDDNEMVERVWPALVFEKSEFGDLGHFATMPICRELGFKDRLELCMGIGIAVADMHCNGKSHAGVDEQQCLHI